MLFLIDITYWSAWVAVIIGGYKFVRFLDDNIAPSLSRKVSKWLKNYDKSSLSGIDWLKFIKQQFSATFGKRPVSIRFITRSWFFSLILFLFCLTFWITIDLKRTISFVEKFKHIYSVVPRAVYLQMIYFFLLNLFADYFSLLETRYVLFKLSGVKNLSTKIALLGLDAGGSLLIFIIPFTIYWHSANFTNYFVAESKQIIEQPGGKTKIFTPPNEDLIIGTGNNQIVFDRRKTLLIVDTKTNLSKHSLKAMAKLLVLISPSQLSIVPPGIYFYTSLFSSIWIWLFFIGSGLIKLLNFLFGSLPQYLKIEKNPITSVYLCLCPLFILFAIVLFFWRF